MKKIILSSLVILAAAQSFMLLSFKKEAPKKKAFSDMVVHYYTGPHKYIGSGNANSLVESEIKDGQNWSMEEQHANDCGSYLSAIIFDRDAVTKQDVLDAIWAYYSSHSNTLPGNGGYIPVSSNASVVLRKSTN